MISQGCKFSLTLGSNIVLARLLTPQDYGLIGMVTVVTGFVGLFKDLGLSMATVQKEEITHEQVSTLFWVNIALSLVTMLVAAALAPIIASFYNEPRLIWITLTLSAGFIISGAGVQHGALLNRQMRFTSLVIIDLLSTTGSLIITVIVAWNGAQYWSLVWLPLSSAMIGTVGTWIACSWRPSLPKLHSGVRSMLVFGGNLTGFSIVNYFARNADNLLIGRFWGAQQLGFYTKAYQLLVLPIQQINGPIAAVAVPALSRLQSDPRQFRHYYLKALSFVTFLTVPIAAFLMLMSEDIIILLLGSQWRAASVLFQVLSISAIVQPICNTSGWLYISTGKTKQMFKWGLFASLFVVISFLVGLPYGAQGVATCYTVVMLLQALPCMYYATRGSSITMLDVWSAVNEPLIAALISSLVSFGVKTKIDSNLERWETVIICFCISTTLYLIITFYLFRKKDFYLSFLNSFKQPRA